MQGGTVMQGGQESVAFAAATESCPQLLSILISLDSAIM